MGQYYKVVNLNKRQFLDPHKFGDGLKLCEFGASGDGIMFGLAALLADGNNRGGGDLRSDDPVIGSWAGDRVVITGDYADAGKFLDDVSMAERSEIGPVDPEKVTLYRYAAERFEDISDRVIAAIVAAEGDNTDLSKINLNEDGGRNK